MIAKNKKFFNIGTILFETCMLKAVGLIWENIQQEDDEDITLGF